MSSHIQTHVHFRALQKAILHLIETDRDFKSYLTHHMVRGLNDPSFEELTNDGLSWVIVTLLVTAQVACVNAQNIQHMDEGDDINEVVQDQIRQIIADAQRVKGAPFYEGAPVHIMLRGFLYQCEDYHFEDTELDLKTTEQALYGIKLAEYIDYHILDSIARRQLPRDSVEYWSLHEDDLGTGDDEPILLSRL